MPSYHVTPRKYIFIAYNFGYYNREYLGNNHFYNIVGKEDVKIKTKDGPIYHSEICQAYSICMHECDLYRTIV